MPPNFRQLAPKSNAPLDQLLLALAAEFKPIDHQAALESLDELARPLFGVAALPAEEAVKELIEVLAHQAGLRVEDHTPESLLLDQVLQRREGHPALLAAIYLEVARRAGVTSVLVSCRRDWYVGFEGPGELLLLAPAPYDDLTQCGTQLRRRCAHELCHAVLRELAVGLRSQGQEEEAAEAVGLRTMLPPTHCASNRGDRNR